MGKTLMAFDPEPVRNREGKLIARLILPFGESPRNCCYRCLFSRHQEGRDYDLATIAITFRFNPAVKARQRP